MVESGEIITCIEQTKDGKLLILGTKNGKILFYDMRKISEPLQKIKTHHGPVNCLNIAVNTVSGLFLGLRGLGTVARAAGKGVGQSGLERQFQ